MSNSNGEEHVSLYFLIFSVLLAFVLILSKILHNTPKINTFVSEAALILIVGMMAGCLIHLLFRGGEASDNAEDLDIATTLLSFTPKVFYMALLPPILFYSGYQFRRELFFRHIQPIFLFSCVGTTITALTTAMVLFGVLNLGWMGEFTPSLSELLAFGSLIAATDTVSVLAIFQAKQVDPHLFYLVFGESALNDAVAIVLFRTFSDMGSAATVTSSLARLPLDLIIQGVGSPLVGMVSGIGVALIFNHIDLRDFQMLELSLYMLLMYMPFLIAEHLHMSGIVTIFFTGMSARRYIVPNVSLETQVASESIFRLAAFLSETCIFLELGLSVFGLKGSFLWPFITWAFLASLLGRAISVYPLSYFHNWSIRTVAETDDQPLQTTASNVSEGDDNDQNSVPPTPPRMMYDMLRVSSVVSTGSNHSHASRKKFRTPQKRKDKKISLAEAHVLWFAGLRGAVAYACAREFPNDVGHRDEIVAGTMVIVLVSIIVMGGATEPLLRFLKVDMGVDEEEYMKVWRSERQLKGRFHTFENNLHRFAVRNETLGQKQEFGTNSDTDDESINPFDYQESSVVEIAGTTRTV